jgi:hypothetical protein
MRPSNCKGTILGMTGIVMLVLTTLTGCAGIEVLDATPAVSPPELTTARPSEGDALHNLAIQSVDFDPPLNYHQLIVQRKSLTLLVTVENLGSSPEQDVTVRAELSTSHDPELSLTQGASMASIAPGEVQVFRFSRLGAIPYHQSYRLEVSVDAVTGEQDLADNFKAFDIEIQQE